MKINFEEYNEELIWLRRYFHSHPEPSLHEYQTVSFIDRYLKKLGLQTIKIGNTGLSAMIWSNNKNGKTLALRAEMDAVRIQETNTFPWISQEKNLMHACGHDGILATTLIIAKILSKNKENLPINIKLIFQPGEENGTGAQMMIKNNVMENPKVDYFLMFHYVNDAPMGMELNVGAASAAIGSVKIEITGKSSHWSMADDGVNTIDTAREILNIVKDVNQQYSSDSSFVLGIGTINGGNFANVIAEKTDLMGTLRAMKLDDYFNLRKLLIDKVQNISSKSAIVIDVDNSPIPPIYNDPVLIKQGFNSGKKILKTKAQLVDSEFLAGDNAAYFFKHSKGLYFVFTASKQGKINYPLHNGKFDFDEHILLNSVKILCDFITSFGTGR